MAQNFETFGNFFECGPNTNLGLQPQIRILNKDKFDRFFNLELDEKLTVSLQNQAFGIR
jgi:hypothetical protein